MDMCSTILVGDQEVGDRTDQWWSIYAHSLLNQLQYPFDASVREDFNRAYLELGGKGERVLGFADLRLDKHKFPRGFEFSTDEVFMHNIWSNYI